MVTQQFVKSRKVYKLIFEVPAAQLPEGIQVKSLTVAGSFNKWKRKSDSLEKDKQGNFKTTVEVKKPGAYEYRFLLNGNTWLNDWQADGYTPNAHGSDNCVVNVQATD